MDILIMGALALAVVALSNLVYEHWRDNSRQRQYLESEKRDIRRAIEYQRKKELGVLTESDRLYYVYGRRLERYGMSEDDIRAWAIAEAQKPDEWLVDVDENEDFTL
jgi:hypothetical protein